MNREIKFRGKSLLTDDWVFGSLMVGDKYTNTDETLSQNNYIIADFLVPVDPKTVGQYIGVDDKNKTEIYDGDILKDDDVIFFVYYSLSRFCFAVEGNSKFGTRLGKVFSSQIEEYTEIIGNIHDNPELLEDDNEQ